MKLFKRKPNLEKYKIEAITVDGHKLKVFEEPLKMPYKRILQYFIAVDEVRLGIVREDMEAFKTAVRSEINRSNWSKVTGLFEHFFAFTDLYAVEKNLIKLGASFILIGKEDPIDPTEADYLKKVAAIEGSEELKAFFLSRSYDSLNQLKKRKTDFDILEYLSHPTVKKAARSFFALIHSPTYKRRSTR